MSEEVTYRSIGKYFLVILARAPSIRYSKDLALVHYAPTTAFPADRSMRNSLIRQTALGTYDLLDHKYRCYEPLSNYLDDELMHSFNVDLDQDITNIQISVEDEGVFVYGDFKSHSANIKSFKEFLKVLESGMALVDLDTKSRN